MRIILSPAKKMSVDTDTLPPGGLPVFLSEFEEGQLEYVFLKGGENQ